nr:unnamed protein product [Digitaria exilis]
MPTAAPTPKAVLHQRFGAKARYSVEEVREAVGGCPGLAPQTRSVYRCALELPGLSVATPGTFVRKKDAEQAAAQIALDKVRPRALRVRRAAAAPVAGLFSERDALLTVTSYPSLQIDKLGIQPTANIPSTPEEAWGELIARISGFFIDENFLSSTHPLVGHLSVTLRRTGDLIGRIPLSAIAACDVKVDFGCGSGSLLDSLLEHPTTLEKLVGVDISRKGLTRAAKSLHQKLSKKLLVQTTVPTAVLYDGSITDYDSRLYGFDIGTCLEVIEHMEEDQASLFGNIVLSSFRPSVLIVSTPNYEYNPILQRSAMPNKDEEADENAGPCKFRNHDHKFEWTRAQFQCWATDLAVKHNYSVEFCGVGGSGEEPGYASQIAVFRRMTRNLEPICQNEDQDQPYELLWEWPNASIPA